jgi:hypothetical protein
LKSIKEGVKIGLHYKNLDEKTREYMLKELQMDINQRRLYVSSRLNPRGKAMWPKLLEEAITGYNIEVPDDWLAERLKEGNYLESKEERRLPNGKITRVKVPANAHETLAEGEFNRYYIRGLCARAIAEGISEVIVYRGKQVRQPRPESRAMIGKRLDPKNLLEDLRASTGKDTASGLFGPNSGLTICLP